MVSDTCPFWFGVWASVKNFHIGRGTKFGLLRLTLTNLPSWASFWSRVRPHIIKWYYSLLLVVLFPSHLCFLLKFICTSWFLIDHSSTTNPKKYFLGHSSYLLSLCSFHRYQKHKFTSFWILRCSFQWEKLFFLGISISFIFHRQRTIGPDRWKWYCSYWCNKDRWIEN